MTKRDSGREREPHDTGRPSPEGQRGRIEVAPADLPRRILDFAGIAAQDKILDAPCATGDLVFKAAGSCRYAVGVDASEGRIATAATRGLEMGVDNISFQVGRIETLEFDDGTFDRVVCWNGLHHVADPPAAIREFMRVLRPLGYLAVVDTAASEDRVWRETCNRIERSRDSSHESLLTRTQMRALISECDMNVEREIAWPVRIRFDDWMASVVADEGTVERTRHLLTEAQRRKSTDLEIKVRGRSIELVHWLAAWVAVKLT